MKPIVAARHLGADASDDAIREALFAMLDDIDGLEALAKGVLPQLN